MPTDVFSAWFPKRKKQNNCPEYSGFCLIIPKPSETYVEPRRACRRLHKIITILVYAQEWVDTVINVSHDKPIIVCPQAILQTIAAILHVVEDPSAAWNRKAEKMRPVHVLLDSFAAVYDCINSLQVTIKGLSGEAIQAARTQDTRQQLLYNIDMLRHALTDLHKITQAITGRPYHEKQPPHSIRSAFAQSHEVFEESLQSATLANVSRSFNCGASDVRSGRSSVRSSCESPDGSPKQKCDRVESPSVPPQLSIPDSALSGFASSTCLDGFDDRMDDVPELQARNRTTKTPPTEQKSRPHDLFCTDKVDEGYDGDKEQAIPTPDSFSSFFHRSDSDHMTADTTISTFDTPSTMKKSPQAPSGQSYEDQSASEHEGGKSRVDSLPTDVRHSCLNLRAETAITSLPYTLDARLPAELNQPIQNEEDMITMEAAPSHVRSASSHVLHFEKPRMLIKSKGANASLSNRSSAHTSDVLGSTLGNEVHSERTVSKTRPSSGISGKSTPPLSLASSTVHSRVSHSAHSSYGDFYAESKDARAELVPREARHHIWPTEENGLLCLDPCQVYSLADLARLQRSFGTKLEQVAIKATKAQVARNRLSSEIKYDGNTWRFR